MDYWLLNQYPSEADIAAMQQGSARVPIGQARAVSGVPLQALPGYVEMTATNHLAPPPPGAAPAN
jgi:hypothetical protein